MEHIRQFVKDGFRVYNVKDKVPFNYHENRYITELDHKEWNYSSIDESEGVGMWLGQQKGDFDFIICFDFDIYDKSGNKNEPLQKLLDELLQITNGEGFYSSSTEGNYGWLINIGMSDMIIQRLKGKGKYHPKEYSNGLEVLINHNLVLPPTATICKRSGTLGNPRKWLTDKPYFVLSRNTQVYNLIDDLLPDIIQEQKHDEPQNIKEVVIDRNDECLSLIKALPSKYLTQRDTWIRIGMILKHHGYTCQDWATISRTIPEYKNEPFYKYQTQWDSLKGTSKITKATLYYWLKQEDETLFREMQNRFSIVSQKDFSLTERGIGLLLYERYGDLFICKTEDNKGSRLVLYFYNGSIWTTHNSKNQVVSFIQTIAKDLEAYYSSKTIDQSSFDNIYDDDERIQKRMEENKKHTKMINSYLNTIKSLCYGVRKSMNIYEAFLQVLGNDTEVRFNQDTTCIQFKNGSLSLIDGSFRQRDALDFITLTLPYNYTQSSVQEVDQILSIFKQIQPDQQEYNGFMRWLGYCLTGDVSAQKIKFNLGGGSNGKSLSSELMMKCFSIYTHKLNNKVFSRDFNKEHKTLISLLDRPIRYAFIEELEDKSIAPEKIKSFTDGSIVVERMYGIDENGNHQAKLNINSNTEPQIVSDGGVKRRCLLQNYNSKFVDNPCNKNEFQIDTKLIKKFDDDEMKCAFINAILPYSKIFYQDGLKYPDTWKVNFENVADSQDEWKEIIQDYFEITNNENDFVTKIEMEDIIKRHKPSVTGNSIRRELKRLGIEYDRQKRVGGGKKGAYIGLKVIPQINFCDDC